MTKERESVFQHRPSREEALRVADDLLRRLSEWDMLYVPKDGAPVTSDAPYWQGEITGIRHYIALARGEC